MEAQDHLQGQAGVLIVLMPIGIFQQDFKLWPASASSGETVKDLDVQAPSQTFGIRIPMGALDICELNISQVILGSTPKLGITQVKGK